MAVKSLICLVERHPTYEKTHSSKMRFFDYWLKLDETKRQEYIGDERLSPIILSEITSLGLPKDSKDLE